MGFYMMKNKQLWILIASFLVIFIGVAVWTFTAGGFPPDRWILNWVESSNDGALYSVMKLISSVGSSEIILALTLAIAAFFLYKRYWHHLVLFLTVSVGGVALNLALKLLFQRERPGEGRAIEVFDFSLNIPSYSFPSGHTMRSTILICFLIYLIYRYVRSSAVQYSLYTISIVVMVAIAFSRVILDAHFLSDVLGALSISVVWFCVVLSVYLTYMERQGEPQRQRFR